ncbi:MAG: hypothetical protein ACK4K9_10020, partial [Bacteroidia bacterium]
IICENSVTFVIRRGGILWNLKGNNEDKNFSFFFKRLGRYCFKLFTSNKVVLLQSTQRIHVERNV